MEDNVVICVPPLKELEVLPEKMDLDIIYEDEDVILIISQKICCPSVSGTIYGNIS